jgi:molybdate transport system ATP-binding protein
VLVDTAAGIALSPQARRLGHVFQDYALFPHLSVRQNIGFALRTGWLNPASRLKHPAVERWLNAFGLQRVADHLPEQLSGGQRQRTALARALVTEPAALLLDEPFAALDRNLRQRLRTELRQLQADLGLPMLLITHDDEDVQELAEEVVHIDAGRVTGARAGDTAHPAALAHGAWT